MTKDELKQKIRMLQYEIDSTEEELRFLTEEVLELYDLLDEMEE